MTDGYADAMKNKPDKKTVKGRANFGVQQRGVTKKNQYLNV